MNFVTAAEAADLIPDGATVGLIGGGGGLCEASTLHEAVETRFLTTGTPRNITLVHALGIGDRDRRGVNRFAHEGLVAKVIGGHWVWSPRMQALARENKIQAHVLPGGVLMQLMREIAAGRPGLITHVGLDTFVDPRRGGGRMNDAATDDLVDVIEIDGREYLRYRPFPVDIALLKGSVADGQGNISLDEEPANLETAAMAMAARNSGGRVIIQVRAILDHLPARTVRIPSAMVDAVVVDPDQRQGYDLIHDPAISGEQPVPDLPPAMPPFTLRQVIARRAAEELRDGAVVNYGFGIPDEIATLVAARSEAHRYFQTIEHGTYGGRLLTGSLFGYARNPTCMIDGPSQFDFYSGGGLDIAFLGFGQIDRHGNVNVSKLGGDTVGPGGFIDIAQNARKVVFCGTFDAKGAKATADDGRLTIHAHGTVPKLVTEVDQVTFSGPHARAQRQQVLYVTERAVFRLGPSGPELQEIAPGIDLRGDILDRMGFAPSLAPDLLRIAAHHYTGGGA